MQTNKTDEQIEKLMNDCSFCENSGRTYFPGMSYEQGIIAALSWLFTEDLGYCDEDIHPLEGK